MLEAHTLTVVLVGAFAAGFTTGFAGFGTGLVSSGLWFHALPAPMVPPLVALASIAAQCVGMATVRRAFDWRGAAPLLIGGVVGVPAGVVALRVASPDTLRMCVGVFLATYALAQLSGLLKSVVLRRRRWQADGAVGVGGGFLGGFAGLSGPLPLIWLQLHGGSSQVQRAAYQPFNVIVLSLASLGMLVSGQITRHVWLVAALCLPATLIGAWLGARLYRGTGERLFRSVVLVLLLVSGALLVGQTLLG